jgi:hypothetical protein
MAQTDLATVSIAMYDAASAIDRRYQPFASKPKAPAEGASIDAAVGAAAHAVLRGLFPNRGQYYQTAYDQFIATLPPGPPRDKGIALGTEIALATLAYRSNDGRMTDMAPYVAGTAVGAYRGEKAVLNFAPAIRPFALRRVDQFRPGPPPALNSAAYAIAFNETKALGGAASKVRTPAQTQLALFHTEGPYTSQTRNFGRFARSSADPVEAARLLAAMYVVNADVILACFDAKYHYKGWRPHTAIALADTDGNPATEADPAWQSSQFTPYHPEYPAAHSCVAAGVAGTLRHYFGTSAVSYTFDSTETGTTLQYADLDDALRQSADARVWGGMHFRFSALAGQALGTQVADWTMTRHFGRRK